MIKAPLSSIAEVIRGVSFSKEDGEAVRAKGKLPIIRAGSIQDSLLLDEGQIWVPKEKIKDHQKIRRNDIIICTSSGSPDLVGKCARSGVDFNGSFGAFCAGVRPDEDKVSASYLYHFLSSPAFRNWTRASSGANIKNIRISELAEFEIPLPPLPEQKRIAAILDKADAIRRKRQQAIQLADDFLRAVFLEMFGSVIEGAANIVSFSDIAVLDAPMVDPRDEEYIDLIHIGPDRIEKKIGKLLPALTAREERLVSKKFLFDDRYVLYSKIRPYLRKCAMAEGVGLCSADMYPVRPVEGVATKEFLWMLLLSDFFTAYTESLPARANIPKLNREELGAFTLSLPDYSQQLKFSSIVRAANITGQRVMESAAYVDGAFESLSQKAFSGQL